MLEERREALSGEVRALGVQAEARARLDVKRGEVTNREGEVKNMSGGRFTSIAGPN